MSKIRLGAATIKIRLAHGKITVEHNDGTILGQKEVAEEGDWSNIIQSLISIGVVWNFDRSEAAELKRERNDA
jgi:hypothetical protein